MLSTNTHFFIRTVVDWNQLFKPTVQAISLESVINLVKKEYINLTLIRYVHFFFPQKAAKEQEEMIRQMQERKALKLKQFQEDVKRRVRQTTKNKHQQQLKKDYERVCEQYVLLSLVSQVWA